MKDKKGIDIKKFDKIVLGTAMASLVGLAGYLIVDGVDRSNKWSEAEQTIEKVALEKLNENEQAKLDLGGEFSNYSFLCSDIEKQEDLKYKVNVNGFVFSNELNRQAFTTMNYIVDKNYFSDGNKGTHNVLNKVANIIKNENIVDCSVNKVNDVQKLNQTFLNIDARNMLKNCTYQNFLYGIDNLEVNDGIASFNAKSLVSYTSNNLIRYRSTADTYYSFTNEKIKINLNEEDVELAKNNESYIFDKFCNYVSKNQKYNYSVQELNSSNYENYLAKNLDYTEGLEK